MKIHPHIISLTGSFTSNIVLKQRNVPAHDIVTVRPSLGTESFKATFLRQTIQIHINATCN